MDIFLKSIVFLIVIIFILICIILLQYNFAKENNKKLQYIKDKLKLIMKDNTDEKLLIGTDNKELRELLVVLNNLLEFSQKVLSDYRKKEIAMRKMLSNISHDLKTPLTVVLGYVETIKMDKDIGVEERELLLSKVHNKTLEVTELINKFFDLTKLESGDKDITITRVNLNEVCRKNILDFYEILTLNAFEVHIDVSDLNIFVLGNEDALDRIFSNLISNTIKYGSIGKFIGFALRYDEEFAYVDVCDKGQGIEENQVDKVFERMYTLEDSRNKAYGSSGLGLTITKRLVEKLGGEISLKSKPYEKTTFTFKLKRITY